VDELKVDESVLARLLEVERVEVEAAHAALNEMTAHLCRLLHTWRSKVKFRI
jgi:hypothetical protein